MPVSNYHMSLFTLDVYIHDTTKGMNDCMCASLRTIQSTFSRNDVTEVGQCVCKCVCVCIACAPECVSG